MKDDLLKLYNTLMMIEVKGQNVKLLTDCLMFIEDKIKELDQEEK